MPRLIILLLTLASLTILTVQNLGASKAVSLVVLGTPLLSIPLGLLLLAAVGAGAIATLMLYGLMGLRRPAESSKTSKYKPMGSRVPYPENPDSTASSATYGTTTTSTAYGSGGSAFVTEPPIAPPVDRVGTSASSSPAPTTPPTTPSNVYSPFSRELDTPGKKKSHPLE